MRVKSLAAAWSRAALSFAVVSCAANAVERPQGWSELSHGDDASPNYDLVFDASVVQRLDVVIAPADFEAMQSNLNSLLGDRVPGGVPAEAGAPGARPEAAAQAGGLAGPPTFDRGGEAFDACTDAEPDAPCQAELGGESVSGTCRTLDPTAAQLLCIPEDGPGGPGGGGGAVSLLADDPAYVPVDVFHQGVAWRGVGMRYKGNSSLASSLGNRKKPFRLNFDYYEDERPELRNQRFHGFDELTFSSNWNDDSQIRELFVTELLRDRGIPAARAAFYRVFVDVGDGEGPEYWGLYTMIEDPSDDAMLDAQLGGSGGNLYKPEGPGADWTHFDPEGFVKKTNEELADYADVEAAIAALLADDTNRAAWREELSAHFDVEGFLDWLALNTTMVNWDSYGGLAHNYYLYGAPNANGRLRWIPWDHNLSLSTRGGFGPASEAAADSAVVELFHESVGREQWPLIGRVLSDPTYSEYYRLALSSSLEGLFGIEEAAERMRQLHELIAPHVVGSLGEEPGSTTIASEGAFAQSIDGEGGLVAHVRARHARVEEALAP